MVDPMDASTGCRRACRRGSTPRRILFFIATGCVVAAAAELAWIALALKLQVVCKLVPHLPTLRLNPPVRCGPRSVVGGP